MLTKKSEDRTYMDEKSTVESFPTMDISG